MGKREQERKRINIWISEENNEFLRSMSRYRGETMTQYLEAILHEEQTRRKKDIELMKKMRKTQ